MSPMYDVLDKRLASVTVTLRQDEKDLLVQVAEKRRQSVSQLLREIIRGAESPVAEEWRKFYAGVL